MVRMLLLLSVTTIINQHQAMCLAVMLMR